MANDPRFAFLNVDPAKLPSVRAIEEVSGRIRHTFGLMSLAMAGAALVVGDRLRMMNDPNSLRRIIDTMYDRHHYGIMTYRRPSRGYRRHVRRVKAAERRNG